LSQKFDFNCLNLGCGYYQQHRDSEYVVVEEVKKSLHMGIKLIHHLGVADYLRKDKKDPKQMISESYNYGNNYDNLQDLDMSYNLKFYDDYDENADKIVDAVFDMIDEGYSREDIKHEIGEMLYNN